ncbi:MAG: hypothetical protein HQL10_12850 [Nitrospirae bacterium]|nr:hypothetical protein [Nitrospirota bacterium]
MKNHYLNVLHKLTIFYVFIICLLLIQSNHAFANPTQFWCDDANGNLYFSNAPCSISSANPGDKMTGPQSNTHKMQTDTEIKTPKAATPQAGSIDIGANSYMNTKRKSFAVPINYSITGQTSVGVNLPYTRATYQTPNSAPVTYRKSDGVGDASLNFKHTFGKEESVLVSTTFAVQAPTGDRNKSLGLGVWEPSLTTKIIKRFGLMRTTAMAGYAYRVGRAKFDEKPLNLGTTRSVYIKYGGTFSWMIASDFNLIQEKLWAGLKLTGTVTQQTKANDEGLQDRLRTVDLVPELKYFVTPKLALYTGVDIPLSSEYKLPYQTKKRGLTFNAGVTSLF